jgi:hypothetical protein
MLLEMRAVKETKATPYRSLPSDGNNDECFISLQTVALAMDNVSTEVASKQEVTF